jgi:hypothetical protein
MSWLSTTSHEIDRSDQQQETKRTSVLPGRITSITYYLQDNSPQLTDVQIIVMKTPIHSSSNYFLLPCALPISSYHSIFHPQIPIYPPSKHVGPTDCTSKTSLLGVSKKGMIGKHRFGTILRKTWVFAVLFIKNAPLWKNIQIRNYVSDVVRSLTYERGGFLFVACH